MIVWRFELNTSLVSWFICSINGSRDPARLFTPLKTARRYFPASPVWKMPPLFSIHCGFLVCIQPPLAFHWVSCRLCSFFPHLFPPDSTCFSSGQDMFLRFAYVNLGIIQHIETKHLHVLCFSTNKVSFNKNRLKKFQVVWGFFVSPHVFFCKWIKVRSVKERFAGVHPPYVVARGSKLLDAAFQNCGFSDLKKR